MRRWLQKGEKKPGSGCAHVEYTPWVCLSVCLLVCSPCHLQTCKHGCVDVCGSVDTRVHHASLPLFVKWNMRGQWPVYPGISTRRCSSSTSDIFCCLDVWFAWSWWPVNSALSGLSQLFTFLFTFSVLTTVFTERFATSEHIDMTKHKAVECHCYTQSSTDGDCLLHCPNPNKHENNNLHCQ